MKYTFGSKALDELAGGLETGILTMLYGETSTAKTTLGAYQPTVSIAKVYELEKNDRFIIIDCDGGFDFDRVRQIWKANKLDEKDMVAHLEYFQPTDFAEQHKLITEMEKKIKENKWNPKLIVCDSMTSIYRGIVLRTDAKFKALTCQQYSGKLDYQLSVLRAIAVNHQCPAVITTWPISPVSYAMGAEPEQDFIGGRAYGFIPKCILKLEMVADPNPVLRRVVLKKHRSKRPGDSCLIETCDAGVRDAKMKAPESIWDEEKRQEGKKASV
jgi:RecA/RadA recombinase